MKKNIGISAVVTALVTGFIYWITLVAINPQSVGFWFLSIFAIVLFCITHCFIKDFCSTDTSETNPLVYIIPSVAILVFLVLLFFSSVVTRGPAIAGVIDEKVEEKSIVEYTVPATSVPLLDKESALQLAQRKMGTLTEYVSQYEIDQINQINLNGHPVRVASLGYASFFKWVNNRHIGIPAYITVDMVTQETQFVEMEKGIKFSPSAAFGHDLKRHIRAEFPFALLGTSCFEIDDNGSPYWLTPVYKNTVGLFGGKDVIAVIKTDAITGVMEYYTLDNTPQYVDNVYPADLLIKQYDQHGTYHSGFLNSIFGQKGVVETTEGYNYIPVNDDVYLYTGVTSVVKDESNVGFIFVNKRTGKFEYYQCPGAEEYSAMSAAEGVVQHLGYTATFPLFVDVQGQPSYLMTLKDAGGLVKKYAFVNVQQYQTVVVEDTFQKAMSTYTKALGHNGSDEVDMSIKGIITDIRSANIDGTTYFYIQLEGQKSYFALSAKDNEEVVLLNVGDEISVFVFDDEDSKIVTAALN